MSERGCVRAVRGPDPAAGAEVTIRIPAGVRWRVIGLRLVFVTDATAVNRQVDLIIDDRANVMLWIEPPGLQGANYIWGFNYAPGMPSRALLRTEYVVPLPIPTLLGPEWRIRTNTLNIQAGDTFNSVMLWVEEWVDEYTGRAAA